MSDVSHAPVSANRHRPPRVEDFPILFRMVAANISLSEACRRLAIHYYTVQSRLSSDPKLAEEYMLARAYRADLLAERVIETAEEVLVGAALPTGGLDYRAAKVGMEGLQWAAAQLGPKGWGQATLKAEVTGKGGAAIGNQVVIFMLPDNGR